VNELIALFVFLNKRAVQGGEREKREGRERKKIVAERKERVTVLTSVVTSRFRYSIQTRMGEFIDPEFLYYRYDGNLRRRQRLG